MTPDDGRHSRLNSPYTHESDTSPFTMQSSRSVPSRTNPSFSRTRAEAALRVSASVPTNGRNCRRAVRSVGVGKDMRAILLCRGPNEQTRGLPRAGLVYANACGRAR
jgi:hypothetical protein